MIALMLAHGEAYADPGADYYTQLDPQQARTETSGNSNHSVTNATITPVAA